MKAPPVTDKWILALGVLTGVALFLTFHNVKRINVLINTNSTLKNRVEKNRDEILNGKEIEKERRELFKQLEVLKTHFYAPGNPETVKEDLERLATELNAAFGDACHSRDIQIVVGQAYPSGTKGLWEYPVALDMVGNYNALGKTLEMLERGGKVLRVSALEVLPRSGGFDLKIHLEFSVGAVDGGKRRKNSDRELKKTLPSAEAKWLFEDERFRIVMSPIRSPFVDLEEIENSRLVLRVPLTTKEVKASDGSPVRVSPEPELSLGVPPPIEKEYRSKNGQPIRVIFEDESPYYVMVKAGEKTFIGPDGAKRSLPEGRPASMIDRKTGRRIVFTYESKPKLPAIFKNVVYTGNIVGGKAMVLLPRGDVSADSKEGGSRRKRAFWGKGQIVGREVGTQHRVYVKEIKKEYIVLTLYLDKKTEYNFTLLRSRKR